jgi:hypothetical protein
VRWDVAARPRADPPRDHAPVGTVLTGAQHPSGFVSCSAQDDNLGDLVLRRTVLQWMVAAGLRPQVLVAGVGAGFVEALGLDDSAVTYRSRARWTAALAGSARRAPTALVYPPGPQSPAASTADAAHAVANLLLAAHVRRHQGVVVKLGRAIDPGSGIMLRLERALVRRASLYTVRDRPSEAALDGTDVRVEPDLAWAADLSAHLDPAPTNRHRLALSFRGDRSYDQESVAQVVEQARRHGLEPTLVTQVRRDDLLHQHLAAELGVTVRGWPVGRSEAEQLDVVMRTYQQSALVVSNRLHSVIFGLLAGATPVGLAAGDDDKIRKTIAVVGLEQHVVAIGSQIPRSLFGSIDLSPVLRLARDRLAAVQTEFTALVADVLGAGTTR